MSYTITNYMTAEEAAHMSAWMIEVTRIARERRAMASFDEFWEAAMKSYRTTLKDKPHELVIDSHGVTKADPDRPLYPSGECPIVDLTPQSFYDEMAETIACQIENEREAMAKYHGFSSWAEMMAAIGD